MGLKSPRIASECVNCNKIIYRTPRQIERGLKRFCDDKCFREHTKPKKVKLICIYCGKEFYRSIGDYNRSIKIGSIGPFCTMSCSGKYAGKNNPKPIEPKLEFINKVLGLHKDGNNKQEIADLCNVRLSTLKDRLKRAGILIPWSIYESKMPRSTERFYFSCKVCHKILRRKKNHRKVYCSNECFKLDKHLSGEKNNPKFTVPCHGCGELFKTSKRELDKGGGKYCTRKCLHNSQRLIIICSYCGKQTTKSRSHIRNKHIYCSRSCWIASHHINDSKSGRGGIF